MIYSMFVNDIPLELHIGLFPEEKAVVQTVLCTIELVVDNAGDLDDINNTVNYYELTKAIQLAASKTDFKLLEPLANLLLDIIIKMPFVISVKLTLVKPDIMHSLGAKACGVVFERHA